MPRKSKSDPATPDRSRVSLPGFVLLTTSIFMWVGLGALVATQVTGRADCSRMFLQGPGLVLLIILAVFESSLARLVVRQFADDEPLRPAWFLIMLSGACHLVGALCAKIAGMPFDLQPGAGPDTTPGAVYRFGLIVGGPMQMVLLAAGLFFLLKLCRESRLTARLNWLDCGLVVAALAGAGYSISHMVVALRAGYGWVTFETMQAAEGPLLSLLVIEAILVRRFMLTMRGGMIAKCWMSISAGIFLTTLRSLGLWAVAGGLLPAQLAEITSYISYLAAMAYALGPAWQIEAVQRVCGEVGVARFSPFASSLQALRLINRTN